MGGIMGLLGAGLAGLFVGLGVALGMRLLRGRGA